MTGARAYICTSYTLYGSAETVIEHETPGFSLPEEAGKKKGAVVGKEGDGVSGRVDGFFMVAYTRYIKRSLHSARMRQPTVPALWRQPALVTPHTAALVDLTWAVRLHRHYIGQAALLYSTGTIEGPPLYRCFMSCVYADSFAVLSM